MSATDATQASTRRLLDSQRKAFLRDLPVSADQRRKRLQGAIDLLVKHSDALCDAMRDDFGGRPELFSLMNDILGSLGELKAARDHFEDWMADEARTAAPPFDQFGATAWVRRQPKGVVGIIGTWNAPVYTLFAPLASALAAGNRAVLKPSEVTPRTAETVARIVAEDCDPEDLAVVTGGADVGADFSTQPWDHLAFTGGTAIGRKIMQAASANLVPVTLELGGKSPVLVGRSADQDEVAERIAVGKGQNNGQICISPDTLWVHESRADALISALQKAFAGLYPTSSGNPDVVPVVNERHFDRVESYVADAASHGARVEVAGGQPDGSDDRRMPLRIVVDPAADSQIAQHEIFGSAVVLKTYGDIGEAVDAINAGEHPLALYYFGSDQAEQDYVLDHTLSGGVSINDVLMHAAVADARSAAWAPRAWATTAVARASWSSATSVRCTRPANTIRVAISACCRPTASSWSRRCARR